MNELWNQCLSIIIPALATLIATILTYFAAKIKSAYEGKVNAETAKKTVVDVVNFVEQVYKNIGGEEKKNLAIEKVVNILNEKGIKVNTEEVSMQIESAVYELNQKIKEDLEKAPQDVAAVEADDIETDEDDAESEKKLLVE